MEEFGRLLSSSFSVAPMHVVFLGIVRVVKDSDGRRFALFVEVSEDYGISPNRGGTTANFERHELVGMARQLQAELRHGRSTIRTESAVTTASGRARSAVLAGCCASRVAEAVVEAIRPERETDRRVPCQAATGEQTPQRPNGGRQFPSERSAPARGNDNAENPSL